MMSPKRVRPRMSGLRARPREQQQTESTRSRLMTMPLILLAHATTTFHVLVMLIWKPSDWLADSTLPLYF